MVTVAVRQPVRPVFSSAPTGYKVNGPFVEEKNSHLVCGHREYPQWSRLQRMDKKQWELSAFQSRYLWRPEAKGRSDTTDSIWVPPSQRPPPPPRAPPQADEARAVKQSHLHGNVGIITNPQPSTTDTTNFLVRVPYRRTCSLIVENQDMDPRPAVPRDRKHFDNSSDLFNSPRRAELSTVTLGSKSDLFDASYANFPYGDSSLDLHVPRKPGVRPVEEAPISPTSPRRTPRVKFEPPTRPGAAFRRRNEKNYSDLLDASPPPPIGVKRFGRVDSNTLATGAFGFQDTRTEVARRSGEFRFPIRMRSAPELPGTETVRRDMQGATSPPAGLGGCGGGGESEFRQSIAEEEPLNSASEAAMTKIWDAMKKHSENIDEISSPISRARRQVIKERSGNAFGEGMPIDWSAVHSPRTHMPGMDLPGPPRIPKSLGSPRSPRMNSRDGLLRTGGSPRDVPFSPRVAMCEEDIDALPCKAASRGHYQRQFSSDPADFFGTKSS